MQERTHARHVHARMHSGTHARSRALTKSTQLDLRCMCTNQRYNAIGLRVGVVCRCSQTARVALVQRATEPNRGQWSLPGGKIDLGETTLAAAARELQEETGLARESLRFSDEPFAVTDVIVHSQEKLLFHYLIAQVFCTTLPEIGCEDPPLLTPGDDASRARWFSSEERERLCAEGVTTLEVLRVIDRAELLDSQGLLLSVET